MFLRIFIVLFILLIIVIQLLGSGHKYYFENKSNLDFAGEVMPITSQYYFNTERFDRELALTKINEAQFIMIHKREKLFFPMIEKKLQKAGLPDDLKYIAVIESALRENVVSSAGAAGIRQLMPATAQAYGLIVNDFIDQRYDPAKATDAAIQYLQDAYKTLNNWALAAAAYNRGINGLVGDIKSQSQTGYYDLRLNNETARYVFRILAMKYLMLNRYDFFDRKDLGDFYPVPMATTQKVGQIDDLALRAKEHGYSYYNIRKLNPWIMQNSLPEGNWTIEVIK